MISAVRAIIVSATTQQRESESTLAFAVKSYGLSLQHL